MDYNRATDNSGANGELFKHRRASLVMRLPLFIYRIRSIGNQKTPSYSLDYFSIKKAHRSELNQS